MGKVKLVIEIDEEVYEAYKGRSPRLGDEGMDKIAQAIANGIPMSDGDLISRSALIEKLKSNFDNSDVYTEKDQFIIDCIHLLENEPTIGDTEK